MFMKIMLTAMKIRLVYVKFYLEKTINNLEELLFHCRRLALRTMELVNEYRFMSSTYARG